MFNIEISRRNLLKMTFASAIMAGVGAIAAGTGGAIDLVPSNDKVPIGYPAGGWLESGNPDKPDFLNLDGGHREYLRRLCLHNPVLKESLKQRIPIFFIKLLA